MLSSRVKIADLFETDSPEEFRYVELENGIRVTGYTGSKKFVAIPEQIDGKSVIEIGDEGYSSVSPTILLPKTIDNFNADAFLDDYSYTPLWFDEVFISEENDYFTIEDGFLYSKDKTVLYSIFFYTLINFSEFVSKNSNDVIEAADKFDSEIQKAGIADGKKVFELIQKLFNCENVLLQHKAETVKEHLNHVFGFCEVAFDEGNEILILVTELTANYNSANFISHYGCEKYFEHNKELLFYERQKEIITKLNLLDI